MLGGGEGGGRVTTSLSHLIFSYFFHWVYLIYTLVLVLESTNYLTYIYCYAIETWVFAGITVNLKYILHV